MSEKQRGFTNNPNGRPKGALNKLAEECRCNITDLLTNNFDKLAEEMAKLSPREYVRAYVDLVKYVIPPAQPIVGEDDGDDFLDGILESSNSMAN